MFLLIKTVVVIVMLYLVCDETKI